MIPFLIVFDDFSSSSVDDKTIARILIEFLLNNIKNLILRLI